MTLHEFPHVADHRKEHLDYLTHVKLFIDGYENGQKDLTAEMLKFLSQWWIDHVSESDMNYGCGSNQGIYLQISPVSLTSDLLNIPLY